MDMVGGNQINILFSPQDVLLSPQCDVFWKDEDL